MSNKDQIVVNMDAYKESIVATTSLLNERQKRLYLANQARMLGRGGITLVSNLSGTNRDTVAAGIKEIEELQNTDPNSNDYQKIKNVEGITVDGRQRTREKGAGRKSIEETQPGIVDALKETLLLDAVCQNKMRNEKR